MPCRVCFANARLLCAGVMPSLVTKHRNAGLLVNIRETSPREISVQDRDNLERRLRNFGIVKDSPGRPVQQNTSTQQGMIH